MGFRCNNEDRPTGRSLCVDQDGVDHINNDVRHIQFVRLGQDEQNLPQPFFPLIHFGPSFCQFYNLKIVFF